jgi:hypothetical protein
MDHLSERRLMELALDPASAPQNGEALHLERCAACATRLADERRLSELLDGLPGHRVPEDFTAGAVARFERASRARYLRSLPWAVLLSLVLVVPLIGIAVSSPEPLLSATGRALVELVVIFRAVSTVIGSVPALGVGLVGALLATMLLSCGLLAGLARRSATLK